jgi:hypothetical protein
MLILETSVLPFKLYLYIYLVRESNPHQRLKRPLHCHYANQAWLEMEGLEPSSLYAKQMFYQLYYIP